MSNRHATRHLTPTHDDTPILFVSTGSQTGGQTLSHHLVQVDDLADAARGALAARRRRGRRGPAAPPKQGQGHQPIRTKI